MRRSRFVGGPLDGSVFMMPGAAKQLLHASTVQQSMTSEEAKTLLAMNPEDRPVASYATVTYTRRPHLEDGLFVYDYEMPS